MVDPTLAVNAYATGANIGQRSRGAGDDGVTFSDFLKDSTRESIDIVRRGETMSARAVAGKADTVDVVQAVTAAELTLQTVIALRDRVIGAYQEIMRMPV